MHKMRLAVLILFTLVSGAPQPAHAETSITPSDVYAQADFIIREIDLLKTHFKIGDTGKVRKMGVSFKPRHVWQKTYEILFKINILRANQGFPVIEVNSLEPVMDMGPLLVYEQTKRIQTELALLKTRLNIPGGPESYGTFYDKKPSDVYHLLNTISQGLDTINGAGFTPSHVFAQVMRVHRDVVALLGALEIKDETAPPSKKENAMPADVFALSMEFLKEIARIQRTAGIERTDFSDLRTHRITPSEVFGTMEIIVAELQTLKASLGLKHVMTPPAAHYQGKNPADVHQILGWSLRKLKLIRSL